MPQPQLILKWGEEFGLCRGLHNLMANEEFVDVTILCQGEFLKTHKCVLAACSQQFKQIFKAAPDKNPIVVLKGVSVCHVKSILQFLYLGEVTISEDDLQDFLKTANELDISALSSSVKDNYTINKPQTDPLEIKPVTCFSPPCSSMRQEPLPLIYSSMPSTSVHIPSATAEKNNSALEIDSSMGQECPPLIYSSIPSTSVQTRSATVQKNNSTLKINRKQLVTFKVAKKEEVDIEVIEEEDWSDSPQCSPENLEVDDEEEADIVDNFEEGCYVLDTESNVAENSATTANTSQGLEKKSKKRRRSSKKLLKTSNIRDSKLADNLFDCRYCPLVFKTKRLKLDHVQIHRTGPVTCNYCQLVLKNRASHYDHLSRCHRGPQVGKAPYVCAICGYENNRLIRLREHNLLVHGSAKQKSLFYTSEQV